MNSSKEKLLEKISKYQFFDKNGKEKLNSVGLKKDCGLVHNIYTYLDNISNKEFITLGDLLWCIKNDYNQKPLCETCFKELKFKIEKTNPNHEPYVKRYCNLKCFNNDPKNKKIASTREKENANKRLEKRKKTVIKKYGSWDNRPGKDNFKNRILLEEKNPSLKQERIQHIILGHRLGKDEFHNKEFLIKNFMDKNKKIKWTKFKNYFNCSDTLPYKQFQKLGIDYEVKNLKYSEGEKEVNSFINSLNIDTIENDKSLIDKEIDILIPEFNLGIEYNGLYWHSFGLNKIDQEFKYKIKHLEKTRLMEEKGFNLLQIFENEWSQKKDIWKSIIRNKLQKNSKVYYARKLTIKEVSSKDAKLFLESNHLQGSTPGKIKLGLYHENTLVSLMTFSVPRYDKSYEYELIRFCNILNTSVVGSASKLFKYFIRNYQPKSILSYANKRIAYSNKNLYLQLGFTFIGESLPSYSYVKNGMVFNRSKFSKSKLKHLPNYKDSKTEKQIMFENGYRKIYDCGNLKYKWITKELK
jgi:hypothetical protein